MPVGWGLITRASVLSTDWWDGIESLKGAYEETHLHVVLILPELKRTFSTETQESLNAHFKSRWTANENIQQTNMITDIAGVDDVK